MQLTPVLEWYSLCAFYLSNNSITLPFYSLDSVHNVIINDSYSIFFVISVKLILLKYIEVTFYSEIIGWILQIEHFPPLKKLMCKRSVIKENSLV